ncbi:MAG TPA: TrmH family RNA methyltransferase [Gaiellaceae bacterium]|nr:TrmH family RNA methyltransferase [Gaiellaceae bacterium]
MITSPDNPRVKEVLRLRKGRERRREGLFVAEGVREVGRAIEAGLTRHALYLAPELLPDARYDGAEEVSARVLAKMAYRDEPEGVLGVFEIPHRTLPDDATLILVAVGIEKPGNLGAMARTADAAGADAILVAEARSDPWNPNAIRASTGAVFTLPILDASLDEIAALSQQKVAATIGAPHEHTDLDYRRPTAFLVGAEDTGLPQAYREAADDAVEIPMRGTAADSLNASAAAAVLLFEAVRQRAT